MYECLEVGARHGIGEHEGAKRRTVEVTVRGQDRTPETLDQSLKRRLPRLDYIARELIGIDDRHAQAPEDLGHRRLAAGDATGEADPVHVAFHG